MKCLLPLVFVLTSCTASVKGEPCIGISDKEKPGIEYEVSKLNAILGVVFVETVFVPVNVVLYNWKCPKG